MTRKKNFHKTIHPHHLSRRDFLKLTGAATASVMLAAGCRSGKSPTATATPLPPTPTPAPIATPTPAPTATFAPESAIRRPEIIKFYPDVKSKVVQVHHAGAWDDGKLATDALRQMLDASITKLTGLNDARQAWTALFAPGERVAIKVNTLFSRDCTHFTLVKVVTECLQEAGVPAEQIFVFDRATTDLRNAGYPVNTDRPGVRYCGTDTNQMAGWEVGGSKVNLSNILLDCDALINIPILTGVVFAGMGISFAMKNHYGTFDRPWDFHNEKFTRGVTDLNALPPIKDRTRLIIGDILTARSYRSDYGRLVIGGEMIIMSFDPVALDAIGVPITAEAYAAEGQEGAVVKSQTTPWLERAVELGLGTNDLNNIELVELDLG